MCAGAHESHEGGEGVVVALGSCRVALSFWLLLLGLSGRIEGKLSWVSISCRWDGISSVCVHTGEVEKSIRVEVFHLGGSLWLTLEPAKDIVDSGLRLLLLC